MKKITLLLTAFIGFNAYSQESGTENQNAEKNRSTDMVSIGFGTGMDFGGIGANLLVYPQKNIGLFGALGYNFNGLGYNVGTKLRLISSVKFHKASPYFLGMYGYNAVVNVQNASQYNKTFYGPTFGVGLDLKSRPLSKGYWNFALLIPIRGAVVDNYMDDLERNHNIQFQNGLVPFGLSIGYRAILD